MSTPQSIKHKSSSFTRNSWRNYSFNELASFVHLLSKRATHRTDPTKAKKDIDDAKNYLSMMNSKLDELVADLPSRLTHDFYSEDTSKSINNE